MFAALIWKKNNFKKVIVKFDLNYFRARAQGILNITRTSCIGKIFDVAKRYSLQLSEYLPHVSLFQ